MPTPHIQLAKHSQFLATAIEDPHLYEQSASILGQATVQNSPPEGSVYNAEHTATLINDTILQPGEIFSFNQTVGPRTVERGFVVGLSFSGNKLVPDVGGGICRTSTALHWAVQQAGLKTVELHRHTQAVPYAEKGTEAAVWWGKLDYKFQNTHDKPLRILSGGENGTIWVIIESIDHCSTT